MLTISKKHVVDKIVPKNNFISVISGPGRSRGLRSSGGRRGRDQKASPVFAAMAPGSLHPGTCPAPAYPDPASFLSHHHHPLRALRNLRAQAAMGLGWKLSGRKGLRVIDKATWKSSKSGFYKPTTHGFVQQHMQQCFVNFLIWPLLRFDLFDRFSA